MCLRNKTKKEMPNDFLIAGIKCFTGWLTGAVILTGVPEGAVCNGRESMVTGVSSSEELVAGHTMVAARKQLGPGACHPYGPSPGAHVY